MIAGLLALVVSSHAAGPLVLGDPEGVSVKPGLLLNPRAVTVLTDDPWAQFTVQRARPNLRGTLLGPTAGYFFQAELSPTPSLLDAVVQVQPAKGLFVDAGRFLVPFGRAQITPVPKLQWHAFSASTREEQYGRDIGLQLRGASGPGEVRVALVQGAADGVDLQVPLAFLRGELDLIGDVPLDETVAINEPDGAPGLSIGASGSAGSMLRPRDGFTGTTEAAAVDLATRIGPVRMQAEGTVRTWSDDVTEAGGYVQGSVALVQRFELGGRGDLFLAESDRWTAQGLASWYADGDHLRLSAEYTWTRLGDEEAAQSLAVQQQLWF